MNLLPPLIADVRLVTHEALADYFCDVIQKLEPAQYVFYIMDHGGPFFEDTKEDNSWYSVVALLDPQLLVAGKELTDRLVLEFIHRHPDRLEELMKYKQKIVKEGI